MYDIAIVGGGPAGLTAAIYSVRANRKVIVLEAVACGGQIINTSMVENYPAAPNMTGLEFGQTLQRQAENLGVEIELLMLHLGSFVLNAGPLQVVHVDADEQGKQQEYCRQGHKDERTLVAQLVQILAGLLMQLLQVV